MAPIVTAFRARLNGSHLVCDCRAFAWQDNARRHLCIGCKMSLLLELHARATSVEATTFDLKGIGIDSPA